MFRRSRFSIRPNVGSAGRAAATPQEAPTASQEASETPKDISESSPPTSVSDVTPSEKPSAASGDGNEQNGEGTSTSAAVQRRKRFSIKPKVAPGRLSALSRTPKSPAKAVSETPAETSISDLDKPTTSSQSSPRGLQSPRRRRPSEDSKQLKVPPKATVFSPDSSGPSADPVVEDLQEQAHLTADSNKQPESTSSSPVKEAPPRPPEKVPSSLPDKEAIEISEKAKTLVTCERGLSLPPSAFSLSRLLNNPSDMQRIAKAQKLRDLLRQEMHKEKRKKKNKIKVKEFSLDPAKMTMRDLIRYLPESNPMTSSLAEESVNENETIVPPSPGREEPPESAQTPEAAPKVTTSAEEEEEVEEAQEDQDEEDDSLMVPQVKVAEDGTLIIDEESLTVEVQRAKGPNPAQERDPVFERGSTTTYSSFRKATYSKPWSPEETDMFFLAVSMVGTDFSMICQLFPHRARSEIKNKFKKEERENSWRVDKAFRERRKLDIEYFSKLLEKILEVQKNRKKLKSLANKNSPKKPRKTKSKKAKKKLSDVEEENEEEENSMPELEGEGEKENEALCNEGKSPVPKPKKTRKRKKDASKEEPKDKKSKMVEKGNEQEEANVPEDAEAALPGDNPNSDVAEKTAKDTTIKPAKLSRGRAQKPLLPLGRKWAKKLQQPPKAGDAVSDKEKSVTDGASQEQVNEEASPLKQANKKLSDDEGSSSEEEESTAPTPRPTRYGRMPKPTKPLNYSAKDDSHSSASESAPASAARPKPKPTAKRARPSKAQSAQESKKPKLVTLRASQSDYSDAESEKQWEEKEEEEEEEEEEQLACGSGNDSSAAAFVPASLRSPQPLISEVEETMEELDILANMPDVLGISQDALCPDASCERAHNETCDHQLDLLVDVIDFLSSEHTEVSEDQSYNEAAETLLTISNVAHLSQAAPSQTEEQTESTSASVSETSQHLEEDTAVKPAAQKEHSATPLIPAASGSGGTRTTLEIQESKTDGNTMESINKQTDSEMDPTPKSVTEVTKTDSPQSKRRGLSKVKPKPNLIRASRAAQSRPETSSAPRTEETQNDSNKTQADDTGDKLETTGHSEDLFREEDEPSKQTDESVAATSDSETQEVKDNRDLIHTDVIPDSQVGTTQSSSKDLVLSETQVQQETSTNPVSVQVKQPVEESDSQKEESGDASASQTRRSRFQRVKPKPNLAQTSRSVRSKPQTTKDAVEEDSNSTPDPEQKAVEVSELSLGVSSADDPSQSQGVGLSQDSSSYLTPAEESGDAALAESTFKNQIFSETSKEPTSRSTEEQKMSHLETSESKTPTLQTEQVSEIDSAPVQESREHSPLSVSREEESSVSQKQDSEDSAASQTKRSRFQRVKPKPNLAQTSRSVRSKPQTTKYAVEDKTNSTLDLTTSIHEKPAVEVSEPSQVSSADNPNQSVGLTSGLLSDSGSNLTTTEESGDTTLVESSFKHQISSEAQLETSKEPTTEEAERRNTSLQTGQVSEIDSAPVQDSREHLPLSVSHEEESSVSQKQDSEDSEASQTKRSRFQRVKPKPNLAQTSRSVRSRPQTATETTEKQTNVPIIDEKPTTVSAEPSTSPQKPGPSADSASSLEEEVGTVPLNQGSSENQKISEPSREQTSMEKKPTPESMEDKGGSDAGPGSQVGQESDTSAAPVGEDASQSQTRKSRFQRVKPKPNLAQTSRSVRSKPQTTKDVGEEDPNSTLDLNPSVPQQSTVEVSEPSLVSSTENPSLTSSLSLDSGLSLDLGSTLPSKETDDQGLRGTIPHEKPSTVPPQEKPSEEPNVTDAGLDSSSDGSLPQRRQRFPKVKPKPNIGSSARSRQTKNTPSDDVSASLRQSGDDAAGNRSSPREEGTDSTTTQHASCPEVEPVETEKLVHTTPDEDPASGNKSPKRPSETLQSDSSVGASQRRTEDPAAASDVNSNPQSEPDSQEHAQLSQSEPDTEVQSQDTAPQSSHHNQSEPSNAFKSPTKAPQSRRGRSVKPKPNLGRSRQLPQSQQAETTREAQADSDAASEAESVSASQEEVCEVQPSPQDPLEEALEHSITQSTFSLVTETSFCSVAQVPDNSTQDAPGSSSGETHSQTLSLFPDMLSGQVPSDPDEPFFTLCLTEIPVCASGEVLDSGSEPLSYIPVPETSEQQPQSDPGVLMTAAGGEPLFTVSVPEEERAEKGPIRVTDPGPDPAALTVVEDPVEPDGGPSEQTPEVPETVEGKDETEIPPTKPRPQGTTRRAKHLVKPNTSRKKRASETASAKEEEEESVLRETNATEESELPGLSAPPREVTEVVSEPSRKGGSRRNAAKKALTPLKEPEESSSGAQRRQTRGTRSRKPAESSDPAPLSDSPPAAAESQSQEVKTPRAGRKRSRPEPAASTPNLARTSSTKTAARTEPDGERASGSTARPEQHFSASQSSVEDFSSQQSLESSSIEEATSVSQYFLSDIFTDVEEA